MARRHAFTLIELLCVISIIAVLMALLLPSLQNARRQSRSVVCSSHLRGIGMASFIYLEEESRVPHNGSNYTVATAGTYHGYDTLSYNMWYEKLTTIYDPKDKRYLKGVLQCPEIDSNAGKSDVVNYGINAWFGGDSSTAIKISPYLPVPASALNRNNMTADLFWFGDGAYTGSPTTFQKALYGWDNPLVYRTSAPYPWAGYFAGGHPRGSANFVMTDGHVENMTLAQERARPTKSRGQFYFPPI